MYDRASDLILGTDNFAAGPRGVQIGNKMVGDGHPVLIVAELSANHNHDLDLALRTIDAVARSGADAVKLQTYTPDTNPLRPIQRGLHTLGMARPTL